MIATVTPLDWALSVVLIIIFPAYSIARSRSTAASIQNKASKIRSYRRSLIAGYALFGAWAALWSSQNRPLQWLGLEWPLSLPALALIGTASVVFCLLLFAGRLGKGRGSATARQESMALPQNAEETIWFVVMVLSLGTIWELLYRAYLQWMLGAVIGIWPAVLVATLAYGIAHGIKSKAQVIASLASAAVFSVGYALSHSLWWLIFLHCALPLLGILSRRKSEGSTAQSTIDAGE